MQSVFHSGEKLALRRNCMLKKANIEKSIYFSFPITNFSHQPQYQCKVALHWDSVMQSLGAQHQLSPVNPRCVSFPKLLCLVIATAFCPDSNCMWSSLFSLPLAAASNLTSSPSQISSSTDSLANHPRTQTKRVEGCPLPKLVLALLQER